MTQRAKDILAAELRGSTAEFLGWLSGLTPPSDRESIPPEMRPAFERMLGRICAAARIYAESLPADAAPASDKGEGMMADWQPIGTAPMGGETVLVFGSPGTVNIARWGMRYLGGPNKKAWVHDGKFIGGIVTHWMPLPPSPAHASSEGSG